MQRQRGYGSNSQTCASLMNVRGIRMSGTTSEAILSTLHKYRESILRETGRPPTEVYLTFKEYHALVNVLAPSYDRSSGFPIILGMTIHIIGEIDD
jgi:hypothetical protein